MVEDKTNNTCTIERVVKEPQHASDVYVSEGHKYVVYETTEICGNKYDKIKLVE